MIGVSASPLLHAAAIPRSKTYADFVAWSLTQGATDTPPSGSGFGYGFGLKRVTLEAYFTGNMVGSPWGAAPSYGNMNTPAQFSRIAQHSALSLAHATMNLGRVVLVSVQAGPTSGAENSIIGQDRNGYVSGSYPYDPEVFLATATCRRFDYFNDETGKRVRVDPRAMTFEEFDL